MRGLKGVSRQRWEENDDSGQLAPGIRQEEAGCSLTDEETRCAGVFQPDRRRLERLGMGQDEVTILTLASFRERREGFKEIYWRNERRYFRLNDAG